MSYDDERVSREDARRQHQRRLGPRAHVDVEWDVAELISEAFWDALRALLKAGGALRIGRSRDGGVWAIGIYGLDEQPFTEYVRQGEDPEELFKWLLEQVRTKG